LRLLRYFLRWPRSGVSPAPLHGRTWRSVAVPADPGSGTGPARHPLL